MQVFDIIPITFFFDMKHNTFEKDFEQFIKLFNKFEMQDGNEDKFLVRMKDLDFSFVQTLRVFSTGLQYQRKNKN